MFFYSGVPRWAASEGSPVSCGEGRHECGGHFCAFSQAAKTMCSSLQCESRGPRCAGPQVGSRDYLKKKKKSWGNWSFFIMFSVFTSYLKANTEFTFLPLRTHCELCHQIVKFCEICIQCFLATFSAIILQTSAQCPCPASDFLKRFFPVATWMCMTERGVKPWNPRAPKARCVRRSSHSPRTQRPVQVWVSVPDDCPCAQEPRAKGSRMEEGWNVCNSKVARVKNQKSVGFSDSYSQIACRFKLGKIV